MNIFFKLFFKKEFLIKNKKITKDIINLPMIWYLSLILETTFQKSSFKPREGKNNPLIIIQINKKNKIFIKILLFKKFLKTKKNRQLRETKIIIFSKYKKKYFEDVENISWKLFKTTSRGIIKNTVTISKLEKNK